MQALKNYPQVIFKIKIDDHLVDDYLFKDLQEAIEVAKNLFDDYADISFVYVCEYYAGIEKTVYVRSRTDLISNIK